MTYEKILQAGMSNTGETKQTCNPDWSLEEQAEWWVVEMDLYGDDPQVCNCFQEWLNQSPDHARAYKGAGDFWEQMAQSIGHMQEKLPIIQLSKAKSRWYKRSFILAPLCLLLAYLIISPYDYLADYANFSKPFERIRLSDGSQITLKYGSALNVSYADGRREITLIKGAAFFDVAHNPDRSFIVKAGQTHARAIGTAYVVSLQKNSVRVDVRKGTVGFGPAHSDKFLTLKAGKSAQFDQATQIASHIEGTPWATAWVDGHITVHEESAAHIIQQLDNLHEGTILILNEKLQSKKLSGRFNLQNTRQTIDDIAGLLGADVFWLTSKLGIIQ